MLQLLLCVSFNSFLFFLSYPFNSPPSQSPDPFPHRLPITANQASGGLMWWEGLGLGPPGYRSQLALSSLPVRTRPLTAAWVLHGGRAGRLRCHTSVRDGLLMTRFHSGYMCDWFSFFPPQLGLTERKCLTSVKSLGTVVFLQMVKSIQDSNLDCFSFFVFYF